MRVHSAYLAAPLGRRAAASLESKDTPLRPPTPRKQHCRGLGAITAQRCECALCQGDELAGLCAAVPPSCGQRGVMHVEEVQEKAKGMKFAQIK